MKMQTLYKFKPKKELAFLFLNYALIVAMFYLSFQIITTKHVAAQFITFGIVGILLLGILTPALFTSLIMRRPLSSIGLKKEKLLSSIILCLIFSTLQYFMTLSKIQLPEYKSFIPLACMAIAVSFFENTFFRGYAQLRFEESFGIIPGIILSTLIYCFYHVGYGMGAEEYPTLFIIGLIYSTIFRLTSNIFILFPLLTPMGALYTNINSGLTIPFEAIYGFADIILFAVIGLTVINKLYRKSQQTPLPDGALKQ